MATPSSSSPTNYRWAQMRGVGKKLKHRRSVAQRRAAVTQQCPKENIQSQGFLHSSPQELECQVVHTLWSSWGISGATAVMASRMPSRRQQWAEPRGKKKAQIFTCRGEWMLAWNAAKTWDKLHIAGEVRESPETLYDSGNCFLQSFETLQLIEFC